MTTRMLMAAGSLVALVVSSSVLAAQTTAGPAGHWAGTLQIPGQELTIEVDLAGGPDKWEGTITIPAQKLKAFPLSDITVQGSAVSFAMKGVPGEPQFTGVVAADAKTFTGQLTQGGGTVPFALSRTGEAQIEPLPASTPITKELEGSWSGVLDVNGKTLRLTLKLANQANAPARGTLVSVDQGGAEIPITAVVQHGTHLTLVVRPIAGTYEGDFKDGQLTGTWTQGPGSLPLVFKRTM